VERTMEPPLEYEQPPVEDTHKQVRDLTDFGYSPEVAEAIVNHEQRARRDF